MHRHHQGRLTFLALKSTICGIALLVAKETFLRDRFTFRCYSMAKTGQLNVHCKGQSHQPSAYITSNGVPAMSERRHLLSLTARSAVWHIQSMRDQHAATQCYSLAPIGVVLICFDINLNILIHNLGCGLMLIS